MGFECGPSKNKQYNNLLVRWLLIDAVSNNVSSRGYNWCLVERFNNKCD